MSRGVIASFRPWTPAELDRLRASYARGSAKALAAELGRSVTSIRKRAAALGLIVARRWTPADDQELRSLWGEMSVRQLAKTVRRTPATVYWRARTLGLAVGCPQGLEYLTAAADRVGYDTGQLRVILRAAGVKIQLSASRPSKARRHFHVVDPHDVDEAVAAWLKTEVVHAAAERHGICGDTLRRWLIEAREHGFAVPPEPAKAKFRWRVPTATIDAVVAWRARFESVMAAALRTGVYRHTLRAWLTEAGVDRSKLKPWYVERETVDRIVAERRGKKRGRNAA